ncbi:hypothetical protein [Streptomyces sp. NPDC001480]|uniref:hypothetical protein n=1 Tax=Streptomyces sp. NPDC001480 TaxID=3364577 RepID=UPI003687C178
MKLARTLARPLALALLALSGAVACQSDGNDGAADPAKTADKDCSGSLTGPAASAVTDLLGSDSYTTSSAHEGASGTAQDLVSEYRSKGVTGGGKVGLCWIYRSKKDLSDLTISFSFATEVPQSNKVASSFAAYKMGALALTSSQRAVIYMACSSTKFESDGSRQTFTIRGETNNRYEPDGSPTEQRKNNLIVMHSGSIALAKALDCKDDSDLPGKFIMPPKA